MSEFFTSKPRKKVHIHMYVRKRVVFEFDRSHSTIDNYVISHLEVTQYIYDTRYQFNKCCFLLLIQSHFITYGQNVLHLHRCIHGHVS